MLATAADAVPLASYPIAMVLASIAVRLVAYWWAARLFATHLGSARWGVAAAAVGVLFVPVGHWEAIGNITNLRWTLDLLAVVLLLGVQQQAFDVTCAALLSFGCAMSDPLLIGMLPLALLRVLTVRGSARLPAVAFAAGAVVQGASMTAGLRGIPPGENFLDHPHQLLVQLVLRGPLAAQYGAHGTASLAAAGRVALVGALALVGIVALAAFWPRRRASRPSGTDAPTALGRGLVLTLWLGAGLALTTATLAFVAMSAVSVGNASAIAGGVPRYTALACFFVTPVLVAGWQRLVEWRRPIATAVAALSIALLVVAVARDADGYPLQYNTTPWGEQVASAEQRCLTDPTPSRLELAPAGWGAIERACDGTLTSLRRDP